MAISYRLRKIAYDLRRHPVVASVKLSTKWIGVRFRDGLTERWVIRPNIKEDRHSTKTIRKSFPMDPGNVRDIPIRRLFTDINPLNPQEFEELKNYFIVRKRDVGRAKFIAKRLMIHRVLEKLLTDGWIGIKHTDKELIDDFKKLKNEDTKTQ